MTCRRWSKTLPLLGVSALLLTSTACGTGDGLDRRFPLSGKVTYNGKPLAKGSINFVPQQPDGHPATGQINDGVFESVTTLTPGDGIIPGEYRVSVVAVEEVDLSAIQAASGPGAIDQGAQAAAMAKAKRLIPDKYADPINSGLTFKAEAKSNTYEVDLKD